jgi:hypothetical protein
MALRKFTPDPDLFDPEDPEGWYGTWEHDDGSKLYGQGSEEMGRPLLDAGDDDPRTAEFSPADAREWAASGGQQLPRAEDETEQRLDAPPPLQQPKPAPTAPAAAPVNPAAPSPTAPADGGWDDDVPPQVAGSLRQQATAAGLSPDALAAVIKHESGWNPSVGSQGDAGGDTHAGLIQFSKNLWPGVAAAAGRPDVSFEEMRGMSAEDQIPFVVAYYKGKGLTPDSAPGDYKLATYKPKYLKEGDDFVLDDAASTKGVKVKPDTARLDRNGDGIINSYEQNAALDTNKDGKVTAGEVRGGASAGAAPRGAQAPGAPPLGGGLPSSFNGLPAAAAEVQGTPLTPDQIAQRQKDVGQRYAVQAAAQQQGLAQRVQGRQEVMNQWQAESEKQATDAATHEQTQQRARAEAEQKIQNEVNKPIQTVDPGRLIKNMSTGSKVLGGIAILMSELGRAAMGLAGMNGGPNMALDIIMKRIDSDVDAQKENIHNEAQASSNRVAFWTRKLGNAEDGISAARAEAHQAAGMKLQTAAMASDIADVKAQGTEMAAQLFGNAQQEIQNITDRESNRLTIRYAVPPPPKGAKEKTLADSIEGAKRARQELLLAGKTPEETKAILAQNGIPYIEGDTVAQQAHAADQKREDANEANKMSEPQGKAEAAHQTVTEFGKAAGLVRNPKTQKWEVGEGMVPPGFVESINPFSDDSVNTALEAAVEGYGRQQSGGVIGPSEREDFYNQLGKSTGNRRQLAAKLNAAELNIEAKRKQDMAAIRNGTTNAPPAAWKTK